MQANVADMRALARRRMPKFFFDYVDGGAFSCSTQRDNATAFAALAFHPRALRNINDCSLDVELFGTRYSLPIVIAPIGMSGMFSPRGEAAGARAARRAQIPFCLSTFSICGVEEVAANLGNPPWLQLYLLRDRALAEAMMERAIAVGVDTLVLTVDSFVPSVREQDVRNGFAGMGGLNVRTLMGMAARPRWLVNQLLTGRRATLDTLPPGYCPHRSLAAQIGFVVSQIDPAIGWNDIAWLRQRWPGRILVKGLLTVEDSLRAEAAGVDGIIVSNHGGRQLDGAPASIVVLPAIAEALGGRLPILLDSGIARGTDIIKAIALGATSVLIGRAYAYGLGAAGEAGVSKVIGMLATELRASLMLMGIESIAQLREEASEFVRPKQGAPSP